MAGFRAHIAPLADVPEWDDLVRVHQHGRVFASRTWLGILADVFGTTTDVAVVHGPDGPVVGIPVLTRKRGPLRVVPPPPISLYNGLVMGPDAPADAIATGLAAVERHCHFAALLGPPAFPPDLFDARPRWRALAQESLVVDISDADDAWRRFSQSLRRKIRRAEEQRLVLHAIDDEGVLLALHQQSYARHALSPPIPGDTLRAWLRLLREEGLAECYGASLPAGGAIAARVVIPDGDVLFDWLAGADLAHRDIAGSHWLVARILREASARSMRRFDFMGANTPGVTDFKRSFGGDALPFCTATFYRSALVRTIERVRNRMRGRRRTAR
ncbi:MAG: GNAT family N-acetyltransferase [Ignavibacteria bacterium]|nr:GNAT family N-acetyltransferase [Ignavibacteria bacterium]